MINPIDELNIFEALIDEYAEADGYLTGLESFKPALKALKMKESIQPSLGGKEMDALSSDEYIELCKQIERAQTKYTSLKLKIELAKTKLDVYRTEQATNRAIEKMTR